MPKFGTNFGDVIKNCIPSLIIVLWNLSLISVGGEGDNNEPLGKEIPTPFNRIETKMIWGLTLGKENIQFRFEPKHKSIYMKLTTPFTDQSGPSAAISDVF